MTESGAPAGCQAALSLAPTPVGTLFGRDLQDALMSAAPPASALADHRTEE